MQTFVEQMHAVFRDLDVKNIDDATVRLKSTSASEAKPYKARIRKALHTEEVESAQDSLNRAAKALASAQEDEARSLARRDSDIAQATQAAEAARAATERATRNHEQVIARRVAAEKAVAEAKKHLHALAAKP